MLLMSWCVALACFCLGSGCASLMCENEIIREVLSPDAKKMAVVFVRDCGATTRYSLHVSIVRASSKIGNGDGGNVFTADDDRTDAALDVGVQWLSNTHVELAFDRRLRVFRNASKKGGVAIDYTRR